MPACHPQAEKSRIRQDNLKPKRENRILTHEAKYCASLMEAESNRLLNSISCNQFQ